MGYEVFRILFPNEYRGSFLEDMQAKVNDLTHSYFFRHRENYLGGSVNTMIDFLKDRDLLVLQLAYVITGLGVIILCGIIYFVPPFRRVASRVLFVSCKTPI